MTQKKYSIFPIENPDLWERYKKCESQFWKAEAVDFTHDDFDSLDESQRNYLKMLIFFFANSDSVVADNLALNFLKEDIPEEAKFFYAYQLSNENVHNNTYALIIENYIKNEQEKLDAFNSIFTQPVVAKKMKWAEKWIENGSFEEKLVAFSAVELILFSTTFSGIFGFKSLQKPLRGLYFANEEISRDEASHGEFAIHYYNNHVKNRLNDKHLKEIILEAYEVERQFVEDCFTKNVTGFSKEKMQTYLQYVTDTVLTSYGLSKEFNVIQPLKYMENIGLSSRENFFEKRASQYTKLSDNKLVIDLDADF